MRPWFLEKTHASWLIASWCLGIVIGVILVAKMPYGMFSGYEWMIAGLMPIVYLFKKQPRWAVVIMILSGVCFGLWRGNMASVGQDYLRQIIGNSLQLTGKVLEDPDIDRKGNTVLRLGKISISDVQIPGSIWVVAEKNDIIQRSDVVTIGGTLSDGFGSFAVSVYRAKVIRVTRDTPGDVAVGIRNWFAGNVGENVAEDEAALGMGLLAGQRRALPTELNDALKIAGLTHVIVASGYNLTILVRLCRRIFARISKYLATSTSVAMILGFMAITGMSPSMSRAGLVTGLSLAAWYYGRKINPFVLLPLAGAITLLTNPEYGWNDLGWQLSFAAFAGVIIFAPLFQRYFFGEKPPGVIRQILGETVSAQIFTLPLIVLSFGVISNVAIIANILVLPLVPLAMLLTFLSGIFSMMPVLGELVAMPTELILSYMISVASWLADQPWAQTEIELSWIMALGVYLTLGLATWWMWRKTSFNIRDSNIIE